MDYLLAVQAPAYRTRPGHFAVESAFAIHLAELKAKLAPHFSRLLLVAPTLSLDEFERVRSGSAEIAEAQQGIVLVPAHPASASVAQFWSKEARPLWRRLDTAIRRAGFVHSGLSENLWKPYLALLNLLAWRHRKPSLFVVDIDFRLNSRRYRDLGIWSGRSYLINRILHDPFKLAQVSWAVRNSALALLKSSSMVADFGRGRDNVKFFLDAAHGPEHVLSDAALERKIAARTASGRPLQLVYFGRLVPYKGIDDAITAIAAARTRGAAVELTIIGDGECRAQLQAQAAGLGLSQAVRFVPGVPYGPKLFDHVDRADVLIATPRVEDTPRAALDAMARGLSIAAYDIDYFRTLADTSGAVTLAAWADPQSLAREIARLASDRASLDQMSRNGVAYARANTQDIWLTRRVAWTLEACSQPPARAPMRPHVVELSSTRQG